MYVGDFMCTFSVTHGIWKAEPLSLGNLPIFRPPRNLEKPSCFFILITYLSDLEAATEGFIGFR